MYKTEVEPGTGAFSAKDLKPPLDLHTGTLTGTYARIPTR